MPLAGANLVFLKLPRVASARVSQRRERRVVEAPPHLRDSARESMEQLYRMGARFRRARLGCGEKDEGRGCRGNGVARYGAAATSSLRSLKSPSSFLTPVLDRLREAPPAPDSATSAFRSMLNLCKVRFSKLEERPQSERPIRSERHTSVLVEEG